MGRDTTIAAPAMWDADVSWFIGAVGPSLSFNRQIHGR